MVGLVGQVCPGMGDTLYFESAEHNSAECKMHDIVSLFVPSQEL